MSTERPSRAPLSDAEIISGTEKRPVTIVEPDPAWAGRFQAERKRIVEALSRTAERVDHVGSTAVPGLPAKPIVDIQVSVPDIEDEDSYRAALEQAAYELRVRESGHRMFRTPDRDVHVHICGSGSQWERRHLLFRDWLRASAADRELYAETKRDLAQRDWPTVDHYADAKTAVIADIMGRAQAWARASDWTVDRST